MSTGLAVQSKNASDVRTCANLMPTGAADSSGGWVPQRLAT